MIKFLSKANADALRGTALVRLDFNTEDDWRMLAVVPTVRLLLRASAKIVIVSHRGRPDGGKVVNGVPKGFDAKAFSLKKDAAALARFLKRPVIFIPYFDFMKIRKLVAAAPRGSVFLLENLRFLPGEENNDSKLAKQLASLADFYVNDAFAVSHRANASVVAVTRFLPSYAGLELEREIASLSRAMVRPKRPLTLILGGAKAADKLGVIQHFKNKADWMLLGGGPGNTILWMKKVNVKDSVRDKTPGDLKKLSFLASAKNVVLPTDYVWHKNFIWDIGPKTAKAFSEKIARSKTILWSGPLGMIEKPAYAHGSIAVAKAIAKNRRAMSITGGGETVMFLKKYRFDKKFSFVSTGGGAMMDFLAGKKLPGIAALA